LLLAAGALAWVLIDRHFDPRNSPAGSVLSGPVTRHVVALSRGDRDRIERARTAVLEGKAATLAFGADGTQRLSELLMASEALAATPRAQRISARDRFLSLAEGFNRLLAERRLPYFIDADLTITDARMMPVIVSYYVEREVRLTAAGKSVRAVHPWRLDRLNFHRGYLGYTRPRTPAAMVLLDQIESDLVRYVLPAIPADEPMILVDERTELAGSPWVAELSLRAGRAIRRHFQLVPKEELDGVEKVGRLLARRRALVQKWRAEVRGLGLELVVPERLLPESDYVADLENRVPRSNLEEWEQIHRELMSRDGYDAFLRLRNRYVWSVQRHEVQHRIDYTRELVPVPEILAKRLDVENPIGVEEGTLPARARDELSAYLSSIVQANDSPLLELVLLARFLFDDSNLGGPYSYAALAAYEGIARELGIDVDALIGTGPVSRQRLTELFYAVIERSPDELRAAADRFYFAAYGEKLPVVTVESNHANAEWRH